MKPAIYIAAIACLGLDPVAADAQGPTRGQHRFPRAAEKDIEPT